jgi:hypothetical protein
LVALIRGLERAPLLQSELMLLCGPERTRVRGLLRLEERRPQRREGRVQLEAQLQEPEQVQARMDEQAPVRGPVLVRERGQERPPYLYPERRLLRVEK